MSNEYDEYQRAKLLKEQVQDYYKEIYTNLQIEKNDEIVASITEAMQKHPTATYTEVIASLKVYLISIIENMLTPKPQKQDQESKGD